MDTARDYTIFCPSYNNTSFPDAETYNFDSGQYLSSSEIPLYNHAFEDVYPYPELLGFHSVTDIPEFKENDNYILENAKGNNHTNVTVCPPTTVVKTEVHDVVYNAPPQTSLEVTVKQEEKIIDDTLLDDVDDFNIMDYINGTDSTTFATTSFKNKSKSQKSKKKGTTSKKKTIPPQPKIRAGCKKIDMKAKKYIVDEVAEVSPYEGLSNLKTEGKPNMSVTPYEGLSNSKTEDKLNKPVSPYEGLSNLKVEDILNKSVSPYEGLANLKTEDKPIKNLNYLKVEPEEFIVEECTKSDADIKILPENIPDPKDLALEASDIDTLLLAFEAKAEVSNFSDMNSTQHPFVSCSPLAQGTCFIDEISEKKTDIPSFDSAPSNDNIEIKIDELTLHPPGDTYGDFVGIRNPNIDFDSIPLFENVTYPAENLDTSDILSNYMKEESDANKLSVKLEHLIETESTFPSINAVLDPVDSETNAEPAEDIHISQSFDDIMIGNDCASFSTVDINSIPQTNVLYKDEQMIAQVSDFHVKSEIESEQDETSQQQAEIALENINSDPTFKHSIDDFLSLSESVASVVVTTTNSIQQDQIISDVAQKLAIEAHLEENTNIHKQEILPIHVKIESCPKSSPVDESSQTSSSQKNKNALADHTYAMKLFKCEKIENSIATEQPVCDRTLVTVLKQDADLDSNVSQKKKVRLDEYYRRNGMTPKTNSSSENNMDSSSVKKEDLTVIRDRNQHMLKQILTIRPKSQSETEELKPVALPNKGSSIRPEESTNLKMMKNQKIAQQALRPKPEAVLKVKTVKPVPIPNQAFKIQTNASLTNVNNSLPKVRPLPNDKYKLYALSNKIPKSQISSSPNSLCSSSSQEHAEPKWVTFWNEESKSFMKVEAALSTKTQSSSPNSTGSISPEEAGRKFLQLWNSESRSLLKGQIGSRTTQTGSSSNIPSQNGLTSTQNQKIPQYIQKAKQCLNVVPPSAEALKVVSTSSRPKTVGLVPQNYTSIQGMIQKAVKPAPSKQIQKPIPTAYNTSKLLPESKSKLEKVESSSLKASPRTNTKCVTLCCVGVNTDPITLEDISHINSVTPVFQGKPITQHSLFSSILENVEQKPRKQIDQQALVIQKDEIVMYVPEVRIPQPFKETATQTDLDLIVATKQTSQIKEQLRQSLIKSPISNSSRSYRRHKRKRSISSCSTDSSSSESSRKRHSSSSSSSQSSSSGYSRRRSPSSRGYTSSDSSGSHNRSRSRSRSRHQTHKRRCSPDFKEDAEKRCVVFVGNIRNSDHVREEHLRRRFQRFGPIKKISIHRKNDYYSYGFVTFYNRTNADAAIDHGNDDPSLPQYTLSFGGRRIFCQTQYSDLDNMEENHRRRPPVGVRHVAVDFSEMLSEYAYKRKLLTK